MTSNDPFRADSAPECDARTSRLDKLDAWVCEHWEKAIACTLLGALWCAWLAGVVYGYGQWHWLTSGVTSGLGAVLTPIIATELDYSERNTRLGVAAFVVNCVLLLAASTLVAVYRAS